MKKQKVFFIGDVALDEYYQADYFPKIKEKIIVHTLPSQMGGMIANAASVFASYGMDTSFLTALNSGSLSQELCKELNNKGIDTQFMVWDNSLPDAKTIIILAEDEHTVFIPTMGLEKMEISQEAMEALCSTDYIYSTFCEIKPLYYKKQGCCQILDTIIQNGCKLWCDLDVADIDDSDEVLFEYVDTLFINEAGLQNLSSRIDGNVYEWLFAKGIQLVIVTLAEKGCLVCQPEKENIQIDGIRVPVVDVTGAGDTFCSSFLYAYIMTRDIKISGEFANMAAAHAVTKLGARTGAVGAKKVFQFADTIGKELKSRDLFLAEE